VDQVGDALIVGVGVDRGHEAVVDAELLVQHLRDRRDAVRRARGVRKDLISREQRLVVHAHHHHPVDLVLGRHGEQDLLRARGDVLLAVGLGREDAGRLDGAVDVQVLPGELGRVLLREDLDRLPVDRERARARGHLVVEAPEDRVVLEQMGEPGRIGEIVDRDDLEVLRPRPHDAEDVAADAAEAVDADPDRHVPGSSPGRRLRSRARNERPEA
jgi:hypothetical protein